MEYEYTINKIVSQGTKDFNTDEEARLEAARVKNLYQADDKGYEYWFDYKFVGAEPDVFTLSIITDGTATWSKNYDCGLDAVHAYDKVTDYGFAKYEREAVLVEPNGKVHSKIFQAKYGVAIA